jgi:hypothetical protein
VHLDLAGPATAQQAPVRERSTAEIEVAACDEIVGRNVLVVATDELLELVGLRPVDPLADAGHRRFEDCRLRLVWPRQHRADRRVSLEGV